MNSYKFDDKLIFDCCEHLQYDEKKNVFNLLAWEISPPIGFDKDGNQHMLWLCSACGQRIERWAIINFISQLKLNIKIKNDNVIELNTPNIWKRFLELLKVESL